MTETKSNKIQILRGIAIIAVVFIHNTPAGVAEVCYRPFLNFSVGLFLFLSGMLSSAEYWNPRKRIAKVVIPYILWTFIYVMIANYKTPLIIPGIYVKNLLTASAAAIMYYVFIYCEFTLLIPLIDRLAKSKYKYLGFIVSPGEILLMRLFPLIMGYEINPYIKIFMSISCLGWFTYYYLGYMLGNKIITVKVSIKKLFCLWSATVVLQMIEGYWYLSMGETNCGTQIKLSAILTGTIFSLLAYRFVNSEKVYHSTILKKIGDCAFGIYFSHLAVMSVLEKVPGYLEWIFYPLNAISTIFISFVCVLIGRKLLGKYGKYFAL